MARRRRRRRCDGAGVLEYRSDGGRTYRLWAGWWLRWAMRRVARVCSSRASPVRGGSGFRGFHSTESWTLWRDTSAVLVATAWYRWAWGRRAVAAAAAVAAVEAKWAGAERTPVR